MHLITLHNNLKTLWIINTTTEAAVSLPKLLATAVLTVLYVCWSCVIKFPLMLESNICICLRVVCEFEEIYKLIKVYFLYILIKNIKVSPPLSLLWFFEGSWRSLPMTALYKSDSFWYYSENIHSFSSWIFPDLILKTTNKAYSSDSSDQSICFPSCEVKDVLFVLFPNEGLCDFLCHRTVILVFWCSK